MKACTKCKQVLPLSLFSPDARNRNGLQSRCKPCVAAAVKESAARNPESVRATRKAYYEANVEARRALSRTIRERDVEGARQRAKEWRQANPQRVREMSAKRRARSRQFNLTAQEKHRLQCFYHVATYLAAMWGEPFEVDHVVPLNGKDVSGLHVPWNMRVISQAENRSKSNKWTQ